MSKHVARHRRILGEISRRLHFDTKHAQSNSMGIGEKAAVHPNDLLATTYCALGIDPDMMVLNHLNQPRELVKGKIVNALW